MINLKECQRSLQFQDNGVNLYIW